MDIADFTVGDRVQLHPATDAWMRGLRYATVERVGREHIHLVCDNGMHLRSLPESILEIVS
jgi:hypothetical protein